MAHAIHHLPVPQLGRGSTTKNGKARARHRLIQRDEPLQAVPPAAEVPDLHCGTGAYLPLEVEEVLLDEGRTTVVLIAQDLWRRDTHLRRHLNTTRVRCAAVVRLRERQRRTLRRNAPLDVSAHVKDRVGRILRVENAVAGSYGRLRRWAPHHADAGRKVGLVGCNQSISQAAITSDANRRIEPGRYVFVHIAAADSDEAGFALLGRRSKTGREDRKSVV